MEKVSFQPRFEGRQRAALLMMNEGRVESQADGAAHGKARFASSVVVNGTASSKVSDERRPNVRVVTRGLM